MNGASFGRRIGNTFPVTLYVRTFTMGGSLADHGVAVTLINETKGRKETVPCVVEGNEVKFSFTSALQYRLGGTGIYTPVLAVDAGDENLGEADWYRSIEIVPHSVQEYSAGNSGVNIGGVVLQADLSLVSNGLSAYEMWKADGHEGSLSDYVAWMRKPAADAAGAVTELAGQLAAAEDSRSAAEDLRRTAEEARERMETSREAAEAGRVRAEGLRAEAESSRAGAENARTDAETTRGNAERARVSAEEARERAEAGRADAENARAQAESGRQTASGRAVEAANAAAEAAGSAAAALSEFMADAREEIANSTFAVGFDPDTGEIYGLTGADNTNFDHGRIDDETGEIIGLFNV